MEIENRKKFQELAIFLSQQLLLAVVFKYIQNLTTSDLLLLLLDSPESPSSWLNYCNDYQLSSDLLSTQKQTDPLKT